MPEADRRVILLPSTATEEAAGKLHAALRAAVELQRQLADKTQFILQFTGEVERTAQGFVIPHEPAESLPVHGLFDRAAPGADEAQLLELMAALLESMRVTHAGEGGRGRVHGGICPGVIVRDADGRLKVTDIGFAPAICNALGEDSYVSVAVGSARRGAPISGASGFWEVLSEFDDTRDDRLSAFIDPEKYATQTLRTFESAADVIAAGFVLQVFAEHEHPYFHGSATAHRVVDNARNMAADLPFVVRRKELRESANPGIKLWCELIDQMLKALPRDRGTAADLAKRFEPFIPKVDLERVKAQRWVAALESALAAGDDAALAQQFEGRPALAEWPRELLTRLKPIEARVNTVAEERRRRAAIEADRAAAEQWFAQFQGCVSAEQWEAAETAWNKRPQLAHFPEAVLAAAEPLLQRARDARAAQQLRERLAADHAAVHKWFKNVERVVGAGDWNAAEKLIHARPVVEHWPPDVDEKAVAEHEQRVREHLAKRAAEDQARERDLRRAREWLTQARAASERGELDAALDLLEARPELDFWPSTVKDEAAELEAALRERVAGLADQEIRAREKRARELGHNFVVRAIASQLSKFVDIGMVQTGVKSIEFTPGDAAGDGRAQLSVALATVADTERGAGLRSGFVFRSTPEPGSVRDEDGALRDWLVRGLTERLIELQKSKLADVATGLHAELFPKAELTCELSGLSERVKATAHLLGKGQAPGDVETEFRWDPKTLTWTHVDAAAFATKAVGLVAAVTRKLASSKLLDQSESLKPYKPVIAIDVALAEKPEAGVIPKAVRLEGKLSLKVGGNGEQTLLQTFPLECAKLGSLSLKSDLLKPAELALRDAVVKAQNAGRDALNVSLEQRFKTAGARVRTTALPKKIVDPVGEVAFELKPKQGGAVTLTAAWNASTFAYDVPPTWESTLAGVLAPSDRTTDTGATDSTPNRLPLFIGGGAVLALGAAAAIYFAFLKPDPTPPPPPPPPPPVVVDLKAGALGARVDGEALKIAFAYEVAAPDGATVQPFVVRFWWDDGDGVLDVSKDQAVGEVPGVASDGAQRAALEIALPRPPAAEQRTMIAALDTSSWSEGADQPHGNNSATCVVEIPGPAITPPPVTPDLQLTSLTVDEVTITSTATTARVAYELVAAADFAPAAFQLKFYWDSDGNAQFTAGQDAMIGEPLPVEPEQRSGAATFAIPLDAVRAADEDRTLLVVLDTSTWTAELPEKNVLSRTVRIPKTAPAVVEPPPATNELIAGELDVVVGSDAITATFKYEVQQSNNENVPPFAIRIFWDTNEDGDFDAGEELFAGAAPDLTVGQHIATGTTALPSDRARKRDETVIAELVATDWPTPEGDPNNNRARPVVVATREPENLVAELRAAHKALDPAAVPLATLAEALSVLVPEALEPDDARAARVFLLDAGASATIEKETLVEGQDAVSLDLVVTLNAEMGQVRAAFKMERSNGTWAPGSDSHSRLVALGKLARDKVDPSIAAVLADAQQRSTRGELAAAHAAAAPLAPLLPLMPESAAAKGLTELLATLPPRYVADAPPEALSGYSPGEIDPQSSYPATLTDRAGRALLLVSQPPVDGGAWQIFYIDAVEWAGTPNGAPRPFESFQEADDAAKAAGRDLPTKEEWTLAAIAHRNHPNSSFIGGLWEWCGPAEGAAGTACGGHDLAIELLPKLEPNATPDEVRKWLADDLITQTRTLGQGLVGMRTILRVHPR